MVERVGLNECAFSFALTGVSNFVMSLLHNLLFIHPSVMKEFFSARNIFYMSLLSVFIYLFTMVS